MEYEEMAEAYSTSEELHAGMSVSWSWDLTELVGEGALVTNDEDLVDRADWMVIRSQR